MTLLQQQQLVRLSCLHSGKSGGLCGLSSLSNLALLLSLVR
jgi:hypothetical protein